MNEVTLVFAVVFKNDLMVAEATDYLNSLENLIRGDDEADPESIQATLLPVTDSQPDNVPFALVQANNGHVVLTRRQLKYVIFFHGHELDEVVDYSKKRLQALSECSEVFQKDNIQELASAIDSYLHVESYERAINALGVLTGLKTDNIDQYGLDLRVSEKTDLDWLTTIRKEYSIMIDTDEKMTALRSVVNFCLGGLNNVKYENVRVQKADVDKYLSSYMDYDLNSYLKAVYGNVRSL